MLDFLVEFLRSVLGSVVSLLPASPLESVYGSLAIVGEGLGWLNWFVPVGTLLGIMTAWLAAIAGYYLYKALLHWIGVSA